MKGKKADVVIAVGVKPRSFEGSPKGLFERGHVGKPIAPKMEVPFRATVEEIDGGWLVSHPMNCHEPYPERRHATKSLSDALGYIEAAKEKYLKKGDKKDGDYHEGAEGEEEEED